MNPRLRRPLRIAAYVAFYFAALFLFAYLTFPYERLRDRIVQQFNQQQTGPDAMRLDIDAVGPHWLSGVEATGIRLISRGKPVTDATTGAVALKPDVLQIERAHARVGLLGLLIGSVRVSFGAEAFGGTLSGNTYESDGARRVEVELDEVSLAQAPVLAEAVGLPLEGLVNGELEMVLPEGKLARADGTVGLKITSIGVGDGKAKIRDTIALPKINAGDLTFEGQSTAGQLKVTSFSATGPDLELVSEGSVRLRDPVATSLLSLTARFRFTQRYTNQSELTRTLFGTPGSSMPGLFDLDPKNKRAKRPDGFYGWRVSGQLGQPVFVPSASNAGAGAAGTPLGG